jgi:CRP-like cAMP-binding protein
MGEMTNKPNSTAVFSGDLSYFGLGDLLQLIGSHGSTGTLFLKSPYDEKSGIIFFSKGNPVDAEYGTSVGLPAIYELFGWSRGDFEFFIHPVDNAVTIHDSRMQIILSGLKMLDEGKVRKIGPISFEKSSENEMVLGIPQPVIKGPLIDYIYVVDEEEFEAGNDIVLEGKYGNWLWVILEGTVQIIKETKEGRINIVNIGPGAFVGSIASFLLGDYVRSATVVAKDRVSLGVLDSHRLSMEFGSLSPALKSIFLSLDKRLKQVTDRTMDYYNNTEPQYDLDKMEVFIRQGNADKKVTLIREGRASVVRKTENGNVLLANLYPDDFIGHVPFIDMDHEHLSASVYTSKNLKVEELDVSEMIAEYGRLSSTFKNIINNIAACMSATSMMACEFKKKHAQNSS